MFLSAWIDDQSHPQETTDGQFECALESTARKRRGVTALEYLVMISSILVVVILTVQHIGGITKGLLTGSADATSKTINKK